MRVTRANGRELNEVGPLLKQTSRLLGSTIERVDHILGDAAYDANHVYDIADAGLSVFAVFFIGCPLGRFCSPAFLMHTVLHLTSGRY